MLIKAKEITVFKHVRTEQLNNDMTITTDYLAHVWRADVQGRPIWPRVLQPVHAGEHASALSGPHCLPDGTLCRGGAVG